MRKLATFLSAIAFAGGLAGGAGARVLAYEGTLTLDFVPPGLGTVAFAGMGVATVNGSAGRVPLGSLRLGGGVAGTVTVPFTDPNVAPLRSMFVTVSLGTGAFAPISGGGSPLSQKELLLGGELQLCILFSCASFLPVPLTVGGTRGAGIGGIVTVNTFGTAGIKLSVEGAPWTIGATTVSNSVRSGFAHGPASGTTTTAMEGGVVQLVTPVRVTNSFGGTMDFIGTLRVVLIPEPGTALLLGSGVLALALAGRRKRREGGG